MQEPGGDSLSQLPLLVPPHNVNPHFLRQCSLNSFIETHRKQKHLQSKGLVSPNYPVSSGKCRHGAGSEGALSKVGVRTPAPHWLSYSVGPLNEAAPGIAPRLG